MAILERIRRMAQANITQFLNQVEHPEEEIVGKIEELEGAANEAKDALAGFAVTYKRLEKSVTMQQGRVEKLQGAAVTALQVGDESGARRALAEKMRVEERLGDLKVVLDSRRATYEELKDNLVEIHDHLSKTRSRMVDLKQRKMAAEAEEAMARKLSDVGQVKKESFDRLEDEVEEAEARIEIDRAIRGDLKPLDQKLLEESEQRLLDDALNALKESLDSGTEKK